MILGLIKKLLTFVTDTIFSVIDFPIVPEGLSTAINTLFNYMRQGMGLVNFFLPLENIAPAIDLFIAVWTVLHGYHLLMWVLRKIPMLSIE